MIWEDLQTEIKAYLDADAFFSAAPGIQVIVEEQPQTQQDGAEALNNVGIVVGISSPGLKRTERATASVTIHCVVEEVPEINRGANGTGHSAKFTAAKIAALLDDWEPDGATHWIVEEMSQIEAEDGVQIWGVSIVCELPYTVGEVLAATDDESLIADESDQNFRIEPVDP